MPIYVEKETATGTDGSWGGGHSPNQNPDKIDTTAKMPPGFGFLGPDGEIIIEIPFDYEKPPEYEIPNDRDISNVWSYSPSFSLSLVNIGNISYSPIGQNSSTPVITTTQPSSNNSVEETNVETNNEDEEECDDINVQTIETPFFGISMNISNNNEIYAIASFYNSSLSNYGVSMSDLSRARDENNSNDGPNLELYPDPESIAESIIDLDRNTKVEGLFDLKDAKWDDVSSWLQDSIRQAESQIVRPDMEYIVTEENFKDFAEVFFPSGPEQEDMSSVFDFEMSTVEIGTINSVALNGGYDTLALSSKISDVSTIELNYTTQIAKLFNSFY